MEVLLVFLLLFLVVFIILFIAWAVFYFVGLWKLFKKCGRKGWESIVPFYNTWVLVEIADLKFYWFFIAIIQSFSSLVSDSVLLTFIFTVVGIIGNVAIIYNISKKFNKDTTWFVLSIFFSGITIPLLGYSKKESYHSEIQVNPNACFESVFKN